MLIGAIVPYGGPTVPAKYLRADGSAVSRATYAALFAAYGTTWGAGDGVTTFNLPDLRGRVLLGAGNGPGLTPRALAATGGEETHVLVDGELAAHAHTVTDPGHVHDVQVDAGNANVGGSSAVQGSSLMGGTMSAPVTDSAVTAVSTNNNFPAGGAHENMQPWVAAFPLVYAGV